MPLDKVIRMREELFNPFGKSYVLRGRLYYHSSGKKVFNLINPEDYLSGNIGKDEIDEQAKDISFFIALAWSNNGKIFPEGDNLIDFFYWKGLKDDWHSNPEINMFLLKNGDWINTLNVSCGEGIILLGKEEEYRRQTTQKEFLDKGPELDYINSFINLKFKK